MKLNSLMEKASISLQEHTTEVKRLVGLAYANLPEEYQQRMALEIFAIPSVMYICKEAYWQWKLGRWKRQLELAMNFRRFRILGIEYEPQ